jgi:GTPase SAR1 family protein
MFGLDATRNTRVLYELKLGKHVTTIPTFGFKIESLEYKNFNVNVWDIGSHDRTRGLLPKYFHNTQRVIFVVDSNNIGRIDIGETNYITYSKKMNFKIPFFSSMSTNKIVQMQ